MTMTMLAPWSCWGLLLIPLWLLLLWLRRRPHETRWVANLYLWRESLAQSTARRRFPRLWKQRLFLVQLVFLLLGGLALMRPAGFFGSASPRSYVFILDTSASMQARGEDGQSRFTQARIAALTFLDSLRRDEPVMLMQASAQPRVLCEFLTEKNVVRQLLHEVTPVDTVADLSAAVLLALATPATSVYVWSDGAGNAMLPEALRLPRVHYVQVGEAADNVALTRLAVRQHPFSPYDQGIYAEVSNFSRHPAQRVLTLYAGDVVLQEETLHLQPAERRALVGTYLSTQEEVITARLTPGDALAVDDVAYALSSLPVPLTVLLVSDGNLFLEKALAAHPWVHLTLSNRAAYRSAVTQGQYDVIICDGCLPFANIPGNYMLWNTPQRAPSEGTERPLRFPVLSSPHPQHPVLAFVDLQSLTLPEVWPLTVPPGTTVLLQAASQAVMTAASRGGQRIIAMGFDPTASAMPLTVTFPILLTNMLHWLTPQAIMAPSQLIAGETLHWLLPARHSSVSVTNPRGVSVIQTLTNQHLTYAETTLTGKYVVAHGDMHKTFVVNLLQPAESNLEPLFSPPVSVPEQRDGPGDRRAHTELWTYLILVAMGVCCLEWYLGFSDGPAGNMRRRVGEGQR